MITALRLVLASVLCSMFATAMPLPEHLPANLALIKRQVFVASYSPGGFNVAASGSPFLSGQFRGTGTTYYFYFRDGDAQFFVWDGNGAVWTDGVASGDCYTPGSCSLIFQSDGNLVAWRNGVALWNTETAGRGATLGFLYGGAYQYVIIADANGNIIWSSNTGFSPPSPGCGPSPTGGCPPPSG